jgi:hypothetical protein
MGSFLYRKSETLATSNNFRDKPVEEKNSYLQENGLALS